jgi:hypothetical protein
LTTAGALGCRKKGFLYLRTLPCPETLFLACCPTAVYSHGYSIGSDGPFGWPPQGLPL